MQTVYWSMQPVSSTHSKLALGIFLSSVERTVVPELLNFIGSIVPEISVKQGTQSVPPVGSFLPPLSALLLTYTSPAIALTLFLLLLQPSFFPSLCLSPFSPSLPPFLPSSLFLILSPPLPPSLLPPLLSSSLFLTLSPLSLLPPSSLLSLPSSPSPPLPVHSTDIHYSEILSGTLFPLNSSFSSAIGCTERTCRSTPGGQGSSIQEYTNNILRLCGVVGVVNIDSIQAIHNK